MTRRDNIIFYTIIVIVFVGIVLCFILFHNNDPNSNAGDPNEGKNSMIDYAAIISAASAAFNTVIVIWLAFFRKTRRDRVDELKLEMQVLLGGREIIPISERDSILQNLDPKYQKPKYERLHIVAFTELKIENKLQERWFGR